MAPKRAQAAPSLSCYKPVLDAPSVSEKNLAAVLLMMVEGDEKRKTVLRAGSAEPEASGSTFYPFFMSNIVAGLVPLSPTSSTPSSAITSCMPSILIPTLSSFYRFSPSTMRHTSG